MPGPPFARVIRASGSQLADQLRAWLIEVVSSASGRLVGLAVGTSTLPLYGALPADDPALTRARILPIDELVPAPADPASTFVARLRASLPPALADQVEPLPDEPRSLEQLVAEHGLSAVVLGLGADGHIAFNQPGTQGTAPSAIVALTRQNLDRLGDVAPATGALTMGITTLMSAEHVALVVAGRGKLRALERVLDGPEGDDVPATALRRHPAVTILADEAVWN